MMEEEDIEDDDDVVIDVDDIDLELDLLDAGEETTHIIGQMHLAGPRNDPNRAVSSSFPDATFYASDRDPALLRRSLPKLAGSVQVAAIRKPTPSRHRSATTVSRDQPHREVLTRGVVNTRIFGDNRQAAHVVRGMFFGMEPMAMQSRFRIRIPPPYMEPVMYASWIWPLTALAETLVRQLPWLKGNSLTKKKIWLTIPFASLAITQFLVPRMGTFSMTFGLRHSIGFSFNNYHGAALEGLTLSFMADTVLARFQCSAELRLASLLTLFYSSFVYRHVTRNPHSGHIGMFFGLYFEMLATY